MTRACEEKFSRAEVPMLGMPAWCPGCAAVVVVPPVVVAGV